MTGLSLFLVTMGWPRLWKAFSSKNEKKNKPFIHYALQGRKKQVRRLWIAHPWSISCFISQLRSSTFSTHNALAYVFCSCTNPGDAETLCENHRMHILHSKDHEPPLWIHKQGPRGQNSLTMNPLVTKRGDSANYSVKGTSWQTWLLNTDIFSSLWLELRRVKTTGDEV